MGLLPSRRRVPKLRPPKYPSPKDIFEEITNPEDIYDYCGNRIWGNGEHEDLVEYMKEARIVQYKGGGGDVRQVRQPDE